jgi:hypothetical protein
MANQNDKIPQVANLHEHMPQQHNHQIPGGDLQLKTLGENVQVLILQEIKKWKRGWIGHML